MEQSHKVISKLQSTTKRGEKETILKEAWLSGNRDVFQGFKLCYDNFVTFGIKQIPLYKDVGFNSLFDTDSDETFYTLCDKLQTRKLTGHAAKDAVNAVARYTTPEMWNGFYRYVLMKDMKAGITSKTINKVLESFGDDEAKSYMIPERGCQLATDFNKVIDKYKEGKKYVDFKFDGVRVYTIVDIDKKTVTIHTREGLLTENFPAIQEKIQTWLNDNAGNISESFVLDGEIVSESFNALMRQFGKKEDANTSDASYMLFDLIPLKDFTKQYSPLTQLERDKNLYVFVMDMLGESKQIQYVNKHIVDISKDKKAFDEINKLALEQGYEGIMIKDMSAPYECKRTKSWLKLKPFIEVTLKIVGFNPGEKETKYENTLGALVCEGEDEGQFIKTDVSGIPDDLRDEIWNNKEKYEGLLVEIRADAMTQNELTEGTKEYSLRFPRFKCFRELEKGKGKI